MKATTAGTSASSTMPLVLSQTTGSQSAIRKPARWTSITVVMLLPITLTSRPITQKPISKLRRQGWKRR